MRALSIAAALLVPATAYADRVPSGRLSAIGGIDHKSGTGIVYGAEASWEPMPDGRRLGYTVDWDVLFSDYGQDPAALTGSLSLVEMHVGARLRVALDSTTRTVFLGGGGALLRASSPLPPSDSRNYIGGYGSVGAELQLRGALFTAELRYGVIGSAPRSISGLIGIGFGV